MKVKWNKHNYWYPCWSYELESPDFNNDKRCVISKLHNHYYVGISSEDNVIWQPKSVDGCNFLGVHSTLKRAKHRAERVLDKMWNRGEVMAEVNNIKRSN